MNEASIPSREAASSPAMGGTGCAHGTAEGIDVFVSYSDVDSQFAHLAADALRSAGFRVWIAPDDIPPGHSYPREITRALETSRAVVVLLSPAANKSPHVAREVDHAVSANKTVIPARLADVKPEGDLTHLLRLCQWVDLINGSAKQKASRLVEHVQQALGEQVDRPPAPRIRTKWRTLLIAACASIVFVAGSLLAYEALLPAGGDAIVSPVDGAQVDRHETVRGTSAPARERRLYLVVKTAEPSRYYPQDPPIRPDWRGGWSAEAFFGDDDDAGATFELLLVEAGPSGAIEEYLAACRQRGSWDGLEVLPLDTTILDSVTVRRE